MRNPLTQIVIGMFFSIGVMAAIDSRSWSASFGPVCVGLFFMALALSMNAMDSKRATLKTTGIAVSIACMLVFVGAILSVGERVYLVNGKTYPRFLATDIGAANHDTLDRLRHAQCRGSLMEIYGKTNDEWVIRCGLSWIGGHTFVSRADPDAGILGSRP